MYSRRVTIKDVASAIGVTPQTVSRVFRGNGYVSEDTKARVLDAADKLKYVPNSAAIKLRTGARKSIAVVFDSLINVYFSIMIDYLHKAAQERGYSIQLVFTDSHTIKEREYREALSLGVMAVISFLEPEPQLSDIVKGYGVPIMIVGRRAESEAFDFITTDDVKGGELAANRLIQDGCKSFAYLATAFGMTCVKDRQQGFCNTLSSCGKTAAIIDCQDGVISALGTYAQSHGMPDGIFCFSDIIAYEVISALHNMGDYAVKIIGYDNIQADIKMPIDLTAVSVDKQKLVRHVLDALINKVESRKTERIAEFVAVDMYNGQTA